MIKRLFVVLLLISIGSSFLAMAQDNVEPSTITADNILYLQSVQTLDFNALPEDLIPASGLFVSNADASRIVTFGNYPGDPPLNQAILWGYGDEPLVNSIADGSITRFLSAEGRCLYAGYRGYYAVWELNPDSVEATAHYISDPLGNDTVANLWLTDDTECSTQIYAEIAADDGAAFILAPDLSVLHPELFGTDAAARVGRILPPLALTMDFDGNLYRWDMNTHTITATIALGALAMFGATTPTGSHYAWLQTDFSGLHLVDFEAGTDHLVTALDATYISHIKLAHDADVIVGVDPADAPGTVSAWLVETGERLDLGLYRHCERVQPDLVQLSQDGATLIIGCDTGIDVWRVVRPQ